MPQCGSRASRSSVSYKCLLHFSLLQGKESFHYRNPAALLPTVLSPLLTESQCSVNARHLTSAYDDTQAKVVMMRARRGHAPGPCSPLKLSLAQDTYGQKSAFLWGYCCHWITYPIYKPTVWLLILILGICSHFWHSLINL